jgi:two-component system chemotaxis response regulator CheB
MGDSSLDRLPGVAAMPRPLRIAIVEDQRAFRDALVALIGGTPGFSVVGAFGSAETALDRIDAAAPDVLLLDIGLPGQSGLAALPGTAFSKPCRRERSDTW